MTSQAVAPSALPTALARSSYPPVGDHYNAVDTGASNPLIQTFTVISATFLWLAKLVTISVPTWLFGVLSTRLTVTMSFTTLLLLALLGAAVLLWLLRYRLLNMYTRLPQEPPRKELQIDLFPETANVDLKPGLGNYLDEFLEAIKVFGYLERPVFHELTRTLQTRTLTAGETLSLEEEHGYCLVVDGLVQIFVKSVEESSRSREIVDDAIVGDGDSYQEGTQEYQLLAEVKNGAPISSLFSILSLFTDDIKLRENGDAEVNQASINMLNGELSASGTTTPPNPTSPRIVINEAQSTTRLSPSQLLRMPPPVFNGEDNDPSSQPSTSPAEHPDTARSAHPDIVARAVFDTTIAVIPASAFRRLTRIYPRATAHIVQVILTRLQRVTLATAHRYLGMTTEVLQAEKFMGRYTTCDLPNDLRGSPLERLKEKFAEERARLPSDQGCEGIALHHPKSNRRRTSSVLRKEVPYSATLAATRMASKPSPLSLSTQSETNHVSPGDLWSNVAVSPYINGGDLSDAHGSRASRADSPQMKQVPDPNVLVENKYHGFRPMSKHGIPKRQGSVNQDDTFRESILECMINAMGLDTSVKEHTQRAQGQRSVEQSPRLASNDNKKLSAVTNSAFGFLETYEVSTDGDTVSISSFAGSSHGRSLADELFDDLELVQFPADSILAEQGERNPGIFYVIDGFLDVSISDGKDSMRAKSSLQPQKSSAKGKPTSSDTADSGLSSISSHHSSTKDQLSQASKSLFLIKPGEIAGYIGTVSSYRSFTNVVAKTDVFVGFLPRASVERMAEKYPVLLLTMAKRLTNLLPRSILHIDFALDWVQVNAGHVVYHQGDESDAIYIVLNGRLRTIVSNDKGSMQALGEFGQGESIGELEVLTESPRPATLHAIRDSELAKLPRTLFNSLAQENPKITIQISKLLAERMRSLVQQPASDNVANLAKASGVQRMNSSQNLRTVTILPITAGVPVVEFGNRLLAALTQIGVPDGATSLNQTVILNHLGRHAFSRMGKLKLSQHLADLEDKFGLVLYVADTTVNAPWTQTCIAQADCILLVGLAESSPAVGEYERLLLGMKTTARKDLVLLHAERYSSPGLARRWLRNRVWINGTHHHMQMAYYPGTDMTPTTPHNKVGVAIKQRVQSLQAEIQKYTSRRVRQTPLFSAHTPFKGDMHRLARYLCGRSIGLVLGGGGARGISQIGVIRALEEAGVPIDIVGGTSIGAFIGALYARDGDVVPMYGRAKKFAGRMSSKSRFLLDLTYPTLSYTTGHEFNRGIFKIFTNSEIEDFWLRFYCNTTNISKNRAEIHTSGYAWRYVRASMSLAGLIPPVCDDGSMLLDGGYIDNLTVPHMKSLGADVVFAVDVGALDEDIAQDFGDALSGFWMLFHRFNVFSARPNPPTLAEVQARLAYVSSFDALEKAKNTPGCLYMRPPIDAYGTLEFSKFDEIYRVGYEYGKEFLAKLRDKGELKGVVSAWDESEESRGLRRTMAPRRASI